MSAGNKSDSIPCARVNCVICGSNETSDIITGYDYQYWTSTQQYHFATCASCGHVYLNPRPEMNAAESIYPCDYYTLTGRHTGKSSHIIAYMKRKIVKRRLKFFKKILKQSIHVLEIGAGDCMLLLNLKKLYPEINLTGIDMSFSDPVRRRAARVGINLIENSIEQTVLLDQKYDLVIMNQVLEHLWRPREVLRKINSAMKPGGMISIETPNISGYDRKFFPSGTWGAFYFPRHLNIFSFSSLARLLNETGYDILEQHSLLSVINWAFSFKARLCPTPDRNNNFYAKFFSDRNPICLGIFTIVDLTAKALGFTTSNQKTIARKQVT